MKSCISSLSQRSTTSCVPRGPSNVFIVTDMTSHFDLSFLSPCSGHLAPHSTNTAGTHTPASRPGIAVPSARNALPCSHPARPPRPLPLHASATFSVKSSRTDSNPDPPSFPAVFFRSADHHLTWCGLCTFFLLLSVSPPPSTRSTITGVSPSPVPVAPVASAS